MNDWEPYNYSSAFEEPYRIRDLFYYVRLPFPVVAVDFVFYLLFLLLLRLVFGGFLNWLGQVYAPLKWAAYFMLPFYMVSCMNRVRPDGKKIYFYLWDQLIFHLTIRWPKKVFFADQTLTEKEKNEGIQFRKRD
ncbi:TcpE family conjugal transfer membrane protein [Enterococcus hirae]